MGSCYLRKLVQRVAYEELKLKDGIDMEVQVNLDFVNYDRHGPGNPTTLKMSPKGLLKCILVETSEILPRRVFTRNSDMILASTMGLCRASTIVPLNEQGMAVEGERIKIASEERFTSINHSFDDFTMGESFSEGNVSFSCPRYFKVLPQSSNSIGNSDG